MPDVGCYIHHPTFNNQQKYYGFRRKYKNYR